LRGKASRCSFAASCSDRAACHASHYRNGVVVELVFINAFALACGLLVAVRRAWRAGTLVDIHVIIWGMPFLLLAIPSLGADAVLQNDVAFNGVLSAGILGTAIASWLVRRARPLRLPTNLFSTSIRAREPEPKWLLVGALLYAGYLVGTIAALVVENGGIIAALAVARVQAYLEGGILTGRSTELFFIVPQVFYYCYIGYAIERRRYVSAVGAVLLLCLFYVFTANTRLPMIFPLAALLFVRVGHARRATVRWIAPLLVVAALAGVLVFAVIGNAIRHGNVGVMDQVVEDLGESTTGVAALDFGYYTWLHDEYAAVSDGSVSFDFGSAWAVLGPISMIPRVFWPEKPMTSTSNRLTESVYGVSVGDGTPITTFTLYGEGYFQFWYPGAFVAPILFLVGYALVLRGIRRYRYTSYWTAMILLHMTTQFRGEIPVPDWLTWVACLVLLGLASRPRPSHASPRLAIP
jgi:oligosaccharide repeat unit polymerase